MSKRLLNHDPCPMGTTRPLGFALIQEMCRVYPKWSPTERMRMESTIGVLLKFFHQDREMLDLYL
jgi:hypothetical protein